MRVKDLFLSVIMTMAILISQIGLVAAGHLEDIAARGELLVGTTGDYRPMSYYNAENGEYEGIDAELAEILAKSLNVKLVYVPTTWPNLARDVQENKFDVALCGVSRIYERERTMALAKGYCVTGKTVLCRRDKAADYQSLEDINKPEVRIMLNPGGTNEKFVRSRLQNATVIMHEENAEIPGLIAAGEADVMITDTFEAVRYVHMNPALAAPLADKPFTVINKAALMQQGDQPWLNYVNFVLEELEADGTLPQLREKYLR